MIKLENFEVVGWEHAIRGMRNPMNSWDKSDSYPAVDCKKCGIVERDGICVPKDHPECDDFRCYAIGPNDHKLMMNLRNAGTDHRKYMRMIDVYVDITAPLYWWKEFDTYKVGTVANSCSTMHKIHEKEFTMDDFSTDHLIIKGAGVKGEVTYVDGRVDEIEASFMDIFRLTVDALNAARQLYLENKNKDYWWQMIQLLPTSYNQKRTVKLNYEVLANIYKSRKNHKLDEWIEFCKWIETLPYSETITGGKEDE